MIMFRFKLFLMIAMVLCTCTHGMRNRGGKRLPRRKKSKAVYKARAKKDIKHTHPKHALTDIYDRWECKNCGHDNKLTEKTCKECGFPVNTTKKRVRRKKKSREDKTPDNDNASDNVSDDEDCESGT